MIKKYLPPLGIIVFTSFSLRLLSVVLTGKWGFLWISLWRCLCLFLLGNSLRYLRRRRKEKRLKKVFLSLLIIFLLVQEWGYLSHPIIKNTFQFLGLEGHMIHLLYVYCGWLFFD